MNEDTLVAISMFAAIFGVVYVIVTSRHRQRMALIEKGMTPGDLATARPPSRGLTLKFGMLMVGLGVGILFGYILNLAMPAKPTEWDPHPEENPVFYFLAILICGGSALIAHHFIVRRKQQG
ncbi:MAG: hypothetical protein IPG10_04905 [Flavobacteriales bacterium]|jgi:hypothetical protein|nr:hypothetical protein [Flavobacteriales bacterium]MBK6754606.1 hypothetical protein [Flavobacteriales bacterium]MBK7085908.1 hypothetical protein [Flavobacteriales bacterium]MBK7268641.1 hypothetical protein [Flavobacteriales bacterium]MBK7752858.1 hypothetical protein [Flavobacteriales bacterium]